MNTYDALPYYSQAQAMSWPQHLATVALLRGLEPPPVENCRVLELGCGDGSNLLALSLALPGAHCHGIDASARQIALGRERLGKLGLSQVTLECGDILGFDPGAGEYDYILSHGVYSWVAPAVQEKLLALCARHLAPNGVAYISYNTRPGWNMRATTRDMLLYHTGQFSELPTRLGQMRAWLDFLQQAIAGRDTPYHVYLRDESAFFNELHDDYLFHEFLEEYNQPVYFYQFVDSAERHGLRYLADADPGIAFPALDLPEALRAPGPLGDLHQAQYLDFLENRQFRKSLLCRAELPDAPRWENLARLSFAAALAPHSASPDLGGTGEEVFESNRARINEDLPIAKAALWHLARVWPAALDFAGLHQRAADSAGDGNPDGLRERLRQYYLAGALDAWIAPPRFAVAVGERPCASPLARLQRAEGQPTVASLRGDNPRLGPIASQLLPHLDGANSLAQLEDILAGWVARGQLTPPPSALQEDGRVKPGVLRAQLHILLDKMAESALLMAG